MTVIYEWDVETVNAHDTPELEAGEVLDHHHCESYAEACRIVAMVEPEQGCRFDIVLVRDDDDRRAWAYVEDGKLPEQFHDADGSYYARVPKRFHTEVAKAKAP